MGCLTGAGVGVEGCAERMVARWVSGVGRRLAWVVERLAGGSVPEVQWEVEKGVRGRAGELVSENHSVVSGVAIPVLRTRVSK